MKALGIISRAAIAIALLACGCAREGAYRGNGDAPDRDSRRVLVIVLDGLRPDYVTPQIMPNLHKLAAQGVFFENHHAAFPTVTRVNAATLVTGAYPAVHGLLGNAFVAPEVSPTRVWSAADAKQLMEVEAKTDGRLLTAETLGETLARAGKSLFVASAGSTGSAFLLNHKAANAASGAIVHPEMILPQEMEARVRGALGPPPPEAEPNAGRNAWAVDAYLKFGLDEMKPAASIIWLSDPDHTAHAEGIGAPKSMEALRLVDGQVGRILRAHEERKLAGQIDLFVVSDHGFSTHAGGEDLPGLLLRSKLKLSPASDDVVLAQGAIYVKNHDADKIRRIVEELKKADWVGAIFTRRPRPGHPEGFIPGTMSFSAARWDHPRAADILVSADWSDAANEYGWRGTTRQGGVAGHGTASPFDVHNTLIAAGPDFKRGLRDTVPSGNTDLAPTICHLLEAPRPATMQGRILHEALLGGPAPGRVKVLTRVLRSAPEREGGEYEIKLFESSVGGVDYMDYARATRGGQGIRNAE